MWVLTPIETRAQYRDSSVLAEGKWYKIGINTSGIYKLDFNNLKDLGIETSNLLSNNIGLYGHKGAMLPEMVGSSRVDDLEKIPIKIISSSSIFGPNDYILFYAEGPDKINFNTSTGKYSHSKNLYSEFKGYFLTTTENNQLLIQNSISYSNPNQTIAEYDDIRVLDDNNICIGKSGRLWVKDEFDFQLDRNYSFKFSNINTQKPVELTFKIAAYTDASSNRFKISWGNDIVNTTTFSKTPNNSGINDYARVNKTTLSISNPQKENILRLSFEKSVPKDKGWLDFLQIVAKSKLIFESTPLLFREKTSLNYNIVKYNIETISNVANIWDVTNMFDVKSINFTKTNNLVSFNYSGETLKEFAISNDIYSKPLLFGKIENQNLHGLTTPDYLIVTRKALLSEAESLANFHREKDNLSVVVTTYEDIINEFSSGNSDLTSIRDYVKMLYQRGLNEGNVLKYLLLFGDGTYNNKNLGEFYLPTYQSDSGHLALFTFVSDDYFGFMDSLEGINLENTSLNKIDIAVGRIPANSKEEASIIIKKIKDYYEEPSLKDWINQITLISDDEDNNIHFRDSEGYDEIIETNPNFNINKIYLDAFTQTSSPSGATYPTVNEAINNQVLRGSHIVNYVGHGGPVGLTEEKVITLEGISNWENQHKYPIFVTATCEFAPYDKPETNSAGEKLLFKDNGGAIALLTTTRFVFSNRNEIINRNFYNVLTEAYSQPNICLGDIIKEAKRRSNTGTGNLKFALLGDPALRMRFHKYKVATTRINEIAVETNEDTAKALSLITIEGNITDNFNNAVTNFNGIVNIKVFDKKEEKTTLANDPTSSKATFFSQENILFSGKSEVVSGKFEFEFIVPKDINYKIGEGKISYYAQNSVEEAMGSDILLVGSSTNNIPLDNDGPIIKIYLGDTTFQSGAITDNSPQMIVNLVDENGINTSGTGVGRNILAIINNNKDNSIVLNSFYEASLNTYQSGWINYPLKNLLPGSYTLTIKAWDVLNNPGEETIEFIVLDNEKLAIENVINYPNPFTSNTTFSFEHNQINDVLNYEISIFTYQGKLVKTIKGTRNTTSFKEDNISWDGLTDGGYMLQKGVYIYNLKVINNKGERKSVSKKLVILR